MATEYKFWKLQLLAAKHYDTKYINVFVASVNSTWCLFNTPKPTECIPRTLGSSPVRDMN
jgi:hypothetical protein